MQCDEPTYLSFDGLEESNRVIGISLDLKGLQFSLGCLQLLLNRGLGLSELLKFRLLLLDIREGRLQRRFSFRDSRLEVSNGSFLRRKSLVHTIQLNKNTLANSDTDASICAYLLLQVIMGFAAGRFTIPLDILQR